MLEPKTTARSAWRDLTVVASVLTSTLVVVLLAVAPAPAGAAKAGWRAGFTITEYFPAPEAWAKGKRIKIPGAGGARGRIDWLYGRYGIAMEGDGVSVDGKRFHISGLGSQGWVQKNGRPTSASSGFSAGPPFWRDVGWRNGRGHVTFPLPGKNKWSSGKPKRRGKGSKRRPYSFKGITFAPGPSRPLKYWRSVAVDPGTIPMGSKVFIRNYSNKPGGGCFRADDTGSAINGKHLDVYRRPPARPNGARSSYDVRVYVVPKGKKVPKSAPRCLRPGYKGGKGNGGGKEGSGGLSNGGGGVAAR